MPGEEARFYDADMMLQTASWQILLCFFDRAPDRVVTVQLVQRVHELTAGRLPFRRANDGHVHRCVDALLSAFAFR